MRTVKHLPQPAARLTDCCSGYFDHQVISGTPHTTRNTGRSIRWTYDHIRITFSAAEHVDAVRKLFPGDTERWLLAPPSPTAPPFAVILPASDALAFFSWLGSEIPTTAFPPFHGSQLIPRLVGYLRRNDHPAPNPPAQEHPEAGFSVRLSIGSVHHTFGPNSLVRYVFRAAAALPEIASDSPARLHLQVVPKIPEGEKFLELCVPCVGQTGSHEVALFGTHGMAWPEDVLKELLQLQVEVTRREWIVPSSISGNT